MSAVMPSKFLGTRERSCVVASSAMDVGNDGGTRVNGDLNWVTNFIWGIADDVLRDLYVRGKYRDVILPMTVLRRLDHWFSSLLCFLHGWRHRLRCRGVTNSIECEHDEGEGRNPQYIRRCDQRQKYKCPHRSSDLRLDCRAASGPRRRSRVRASR